MRGPAFLVLRHRVADTVLPLYLVEVKKPEESRYPWDYYKILKTIPGEEAFRPLSEGGCPLLATLDVTDAPPDGGIFRAV